MVGVPLFLMWVSQTGTFLAQTFQFFYANICCALCIKGRRRRAAKEAARAQRRARAQHLQGKKLLNNTREVGEGGPEVTYGCIAAIAMFQRGVADPCRSQNHR